MDYDSLVKRIAENTVTVDDFNSFIIESLPSSIKARVQRGTVPADGLGIDKRTGHSRLHPMGDGIGARTHPKRTPTASPKNIGRSESAHKKSTKTQRRKAGRIAEGRLDELLNMMEESDLTLEDLNNQLCKEPSIINLDGKDKDKENGSKRSD